MCFKKRKKKPNKSKEYDWVLDENQSWARVWGEKYHSTRKDKKDG